MHLCRSATSGPGSQLEISKASPQEGKGDVKWGRPVTDENNIYLTLFSPAVMTQMTSKLN